MGQYPNEKHFALTPLVSSQVQNYVNTLYAYSACAKHLVPRNFGFRLAVEPRTVQCNAVTHLVLYPNGKLPSTRYPQIIQATNQPPCAPIPTKSYLALTPVMSSQAKSLQTDPVHKCRNLANCGQFTSTTILQTAISSQVPPSTILQTAPIRKNQILQTASYSQISKSCKLLSSYKYRNLANCSGSKVPKS